MNIEILLRNVQTLVTTPRDVAKMRQLILALAVQGKLVDGIGYDNWLTLSIGEIATTITPGFACAKERQVPNGHVHLRMNNVSTNGKLDFSNLILIDPSMIDIRKSKLMKGDVLFNNTNSQALVGKTAIVQENINAAWSNHLTLMRFCSDIDSRFIVWYFTFLRNTGYFSSLCTRWINQAAINTDTLKKELITYPPLAEQRRIVARVDELMALCDQLEVQLQERQHRQRAVVAAALARVSADPAPANVATLFTPGLGVSPADLRQLILALAVQGKLVPQEAGDEPVNDINDRYIIKSLDEVCNIFTGSTPLKSRTDYWNSLDIPWFTINDIRNQGSKIFATEQFVSILATQETSLKIVPKNSVLICCTASVGACAINKIPLTMNQQFNAMVIRKATELIPEYLLIFAKTLKSQLLKMAGKTTIDFVSLSKLKNIQIPLPPLAEQRRIVARVDALMALVDQLEAQQAQASVLGAQVLDAVVGQLA